MMTHKQLPRHNELRRQAEAKRRDLDAALYDIARLTSHEFGFDWTDPRTGIIYPAPCKH